MAGRSRLSRADEAGLLSELRAVYLEVDELSSLHSCPRSTRCCRFGLTGREPYVTSIELAALRHALRARGARLPRQRPAPLRDSGRRDEQCCPLLDHQGRCSVYEARPLGCRTHWCHDADRPTTVPHRGVVELVRRIEQIAERHETGGDVGRPLRVALQAAVSRGRRR
ncbi:MAG: YkgJ family cysteine cluster protein [Deltaproteobacteria bacterium]|jgi:Fe-S-cluster containining protein|nr:YkgJ family cysteine cluster protein [Deltaproteobacteria bacterium]MBW2532843.1 YkgJ family cysteine cluster protein [Deltaproteobacteria bacterium]